MREESALAALRTSRTLAEDWASRTAGAEARSRTETASARMALIVARPGRSGALVGLREALERAFRVFLNRDEHATEMVMRGPHGAAVDAPHLEPNAEGFAIEHGAEMGPLTDRERQVR